MTRCKLMRHDRGAAASTFGDLSKSNQLLISFRSENTRLVYLFVSHNNSVPPGGGGGLFLFLPNERSRPTLGQIVG